jgi:integrase
VADPIKKITLAGDRVRYRFVLDVGRDADGKRKQLTKTYDTRKEARAEYARIKHEVDGGRFVASARLTVNELFDRYVQAEMIHVEPTTANNTNTALKPARLRYGSRWAESLTEQDIDDLVSWMLTSGRRRNGKPGTGLSVATVQLTLTRVRNALAFGVRRALLTRNVAEHTRIPREARNRAQATAERRTPWSTAEVKGFLASVRGARLQAAVLLLLLGMRPAEVCGLRWCDVDLAAGRIQIASTRTLSNGVVYEKGPKSASGRRGLPLPVIVLAALKAAKARQARERLAAGEGYTDTGYVVVSEVGLPLQTDKLRREVYKLMKLAEVRKVRPYDARHACLTYLATSGVPDVVVSAWAGHADLGLAKRIYIHPDVGHLQAAADQLDKLLG